MSFKTRMEDPMRHANHRFRSRVGAWEWSRALWGCVVCQQCDNILIITPSVGVDIDECAENNGECSDHAVCSNTEGSFTCSCNDGFTGNGFTCTGTVNVWLLHFSAHAN